MSQSSVDEWESRTEETVEKSLQKKRCESSLSEGSELLKPQAGRGMGEVWVAGDKKNKKV